MINIKTLATGSSGNCFILSKQGSRKDLMVECGIPIRKILSGIGYNLGKISACLVTHEHSDHARAADALMTYGITVVASPGTLMSLGITQGRLHAQALNPRTPLAIDGRWRVVGFPAIHDTAQPYMYLIQNGEDILLFATDTEYIPYQFGGLTQMMVEANYDLDIMKDRIIDGSVHGARKKRTMETHMEIGTLEMWLKKEKEGGDLEKLKEIRLIHTSAANSDPDDFRERLQKLTGVPVYVEGGK